MIERKKKKSSHKEEIILYKEKLLYKEKKMPTETTKPLQKGPLQKGGFTIGTPYKRRRRVAAKFFKMGSDFYTFL